MSKAKVYFRRNPEAIRRLMKSPEMVAALEACANQVAQNAGEGYEVRQMGTRAIAVRTATNDAARDNLEHNTLLKAVRK